jgi:NADPH:quinone reductase-like Zn-dependent oxidoreductase
MQAVIQRHYGGPEQLELADVPDPTPGRGEVLVRVRAAGIDRGTWHLMRGLPLVVRPAFGLRRPRTPVPGRDVAGTVVAVGEQVTGYALGDEVMGTARGSFAELAVVPTTRLTHKPAELDFAEAAVLPVSGLTALQALRDAGRVRAGQRVLVIGASGGVGTAAVQIARAYGAVVTGVCSGGKADLVRSLGATDVIDHTVDDIDRDGVRFDLIIDIAGNRPIRQLRRSLAPRGTLVMVGGEDGGRWIGGVHRQLAAVLLSPWVRQRLTSVVSAERAADMEALAELVGRGELRPALDRTFALAEAAKALDHLESGHVRGKVALTA